MLKFFKKEEPFKVVACVDGVIIPIENVKDEVFSKKMIGDGFAIIPSSNEIVSPITGMIETIFPTKHAIGLKTSEGIEIIVHIGIDTVNLNGEGFTLLKKEHTKVKAGEPLVRIDRELLLAKGYDLSTIVIFASGFKNDINIKNINAKVKAGDLILE